MRCKCLTKFKMAYVDLGLLIENVKVYPVLYDTLASGYCNGVLKSDLWEQIGRRCNVAGALAKDQWLKLRECHREALRRKRAKGEQAATNSKLWKYEKQMEFLLPYIRDRKKRPSFLSQIGLDVEIIQQQPSAVQEVEDSLVEINEENSNEVDSRKAFADNDSQPLKKQKTEKESILNFLKEQAQRREERFIETATNLQEKTTAHENDSLKKFFDAMFLSTRTLEPSLQTFVKRKVFEAVCEAEDIMNNPALHMTDLPQEGEQL